jgi:uncharacterized membrane protein (DUF4010 family)
MEASLVAQPLVRLVIALMLGALVGLEREFSFHSDTDRVPFAGIRTFPIISMAGFAAALASEYVTAAFPVAFAALAGLAVASHISRSAKSVAAGTTTEVGALLVFLVGGLCWWQELGPAVAVGVVMTLLLSYKPTLHHLVTALEVEDVRALLKFALIAVVILPALPNRDLGPGGLFNPRIVWLMVVFVSAVSFSGYGLSKLLGERAGLRATGLLGGLASSTAVTFSFTQRTREEPARAAAHAGVIALSCTMLFPRLLLLLLVWAPGLLPRTAPPFLALLALALVAALLLGGVPMESTSPHPVMKNPFRLGPALTFGLLFALVLGLSRGAFELLGTGGIYLTSFVAGLEGMDAVTLSLVRLLPGTIGVGTVVRGLLLAFAANTLFKAAVVLGGRSRELKVRLLPFFAVQIIAALLLGIL